MKRSLGPFADLMLRIGTTVLRSVGRFAELPYGDANGPSLRDAIKSGPLPDATDVARYLRECFTIAATSEHATDVLNSVRDDIGSMDVHADGSWIWNEDLAYYVEKYGATLPGEFLADIRARNYVPPVLTDDDIDGLIDMLAGDQDFTGEAS